MPAFRAFDAAPGSELIRIVPYGASQLTANLSGALSQVAGNRIWQPTRLLLKQRHQFVTIAPL